MCIQNAVNDMIITFQIHFISMKEASHSLYFKKDNKRDTSYNKSKPQT